MSSPESRSRLDLMREIFQISDQMVTKKEDPDFLVAAVDRRQALMGEYDRLKDADAFPPLAPGELEELKRLAQEIVKLDAFTSAALERHKARAKEQLSASNTQQKVLGYVNQAISSSGSYMDYKK